MSVAIGVTPWLAIGEAAATVGRRQRVSPWFWLEGEARLVTCTRSTDAHEQRWTHPGRRTLRVVPRPTLHRWYQVVGGDERSRLVEVRESTQEADAPSGAVARPAGRPTLQRVALDPSEAGETEDADRLLEAREDVPITTPAGTFVASYRRVAPANDHREEVSVETWSLAQLPLPVRRRTTWRRRFAGGLSAPLEEVTELVAVEPLRARPGPLPPERTPWSRLRVGTRLETVTRETEVAEWRRESVGCTVRARRAREPSRHGGSTTFFFESTETEWSLLERVVAVDERGVQLESARGSCGLWGPARRRSVDLYEPAASERGELLEARADQPVVVPAGTFVAAYRRVAQRDAGGPRRRVEVETWTVQHLPVPLRRRVTWRILGHEGAWSPPGEEVTELVSVGASTAPPPIARSALRASPAIDPRFPGLTPPF